jgi:hypothetical protein
MIANSDQRISHSALLDNAPEHLTFIGLIAANWAILESSLCHLLCFMLDIDWPAARAILYTISSNKTRRDVIWNVANSQHYSAESLKQLEKALQKVKRVAEQRNDFMHYTYGIAAGGVVVQHKPNPREARDEVRTITARELEQLAIEIAIATELINKLPAAFHGQTRYPRT